jgi:hypothetical protein
LRRSRLYDPCNTLLLLFLLNPHRAAASWLSVKCMQLAAVPATKYVAPEGL